MGGNVNPLALSPSSQTQTVIRRVWGCIALVLTKHQVAVDNNNDNNNNNNNNNNFNNNENELSNITVSFLNYSWFRF